MPSPHKRAVNLFVNGELIAERWTHRHAPADYYVVDGTIYDVLSFTPDATGGFDVVVARRV